MNKNNELLLYAMEFIYSDKQVWKWHRELQKEYNEWQDQLEQIRNAEEVWQRNKALEAV
jgi:hypothetical protein